MRKRLPETQVLVIAAHPDDEVLGCGGTMALHTRSGHPVTVMIVADGRAASAATNGFAQRSYTCNALAQLGVEDVRLLGYPDQRLDTLPLVDVISPLEQVVHEVCPQIIYCQYGGDINQDHEVVFKAMLVAARPTESSIQSIYAFDTASSTEWAYPRSFVPDTWVDISSTLQSKLAAMACYESELRDYPHPRSLDGLRCRAQSHGAYCCLPAAEIFMTVRRVIRDDQTPV